MSAPVGASCPSPSLLRLARSYSAPLCSFITRWTPGHNTRRGLLAFLSLQHTGGTALVGRSPSASSARRPYTAFSRFTSSLPVLRLSFLTSAGVSSSAHATEMQTSPSCYTKGLNQAMERTASRRVTGLRMTSIRQFAPTDALARGSTSLSR